MDNKRDDARTVFEAVAMSTFDVSHDVWTVIRALSKSALYMNVVSQYDVERDGRVIGKFSVTRKRKTEEGHMLFNVILVDLHKNVDDCISTHILYCSNPLFEESTNNFMTWWKSYSFENASLMCT